MLDLTKNLTKKVHQLPKDGETENFHSVPQIFSSLRLELVFWPDRPDLALEKGLQINQFSEKFSAIDLDPPRVTNIDILRHSSRKFEFSGTQNFLIAKACI